LQQLLGPEWRVEVVDVVSNPARAEQAGVLATPMLSYEYPEEPRRVIGDLSDVRRVLDFLGLEVKEK
jgi:circadian clock protein KaiB